MLHKALKNLKFSNLPNLPGKISIVKTDKFLEGRR